MSSESVEELTSILKTRAYHDSARIFVSGHSLVDQPLPDFLAEVAQTAGTPIEWNRQYVVGSSIRRRVQGGDLESRDWAGYREGDNREGAGLDVLAEFREPQTIKGGSYDVLLITEQHSLLDTLSGNDTIRYLRHYHDHFIAANPSGTTYFYEPWLGINDKNSPERWIAHERLASPIWQCMTTRINVSLKAEGRSDRIISLPAGAALAHLVERATQGKGLPGITLGSVRETVDSLVADDVHLTSLGSGYMALVTYSAIFQRPAPESWRPSQISQEKVQILRRAASEFTARYYANYAPLSLRECREQLLQGGSSDHWSYVQDTYWREELGFLHAAARRLSRVMQWRSILAREDITNPFFFDPKADKSYWFPKAGRL